MITLQKNISLVLLGVLFLSVLSSGIALLTVRRGEDVYRNLITWNEEQARAIYEMEIAWLEEKRLISSYLIDGNVKWLHKLVEERPDFEIWLKKLEGSGLETDQQKLANEIRKKFQEYDSRITDLIDTADSGISDTQHVWLEEISEGSFGIYDLCEQLTNANNRDIEHAINARKIQIERANFWVAVFITLLASLLVTAAWLLRSGLFNPLGHVLYKAEEDHRIKSQTSTAGKIHSLGVYIDNLRTEVDNIRSRLTLSEKRLLDAEKLASIGRLAASIAHEVRSPLTAIKLRLFSVQKAFEKNKRQRDFDLISEEIMRLDNIVSDFLEFSHPRQLNLKKCDVAELVDKTLELLDYKLKAANVRMECENSENLPEVMADPQQFRQVIINLLNNSVEAMPDGGVIRIVTQRNKYGEKNGECIRISIADTGPGIPESIRDTIFEPFAGTKNEGAGLGLWVSQRIMSRHRGGIKLSESGQRGTVFTLWLPAADGEYDE